MCTFKLVVLHSNTWLVFIPLIPLLDFCTVFKKTNCKQLPVRLLERWYQGEIFTGNQGTRFPRNLQTHKKFLQHFTLFWRKFDFKVCISCQMKKFFLSHTCRKYFLSQEETSCKWLIAKGRNLLLQKGIVYQGQKFLSQE